MFSRKLIRMGRYYTTEDLERDRKKLATVTFNGPSRWQRFWRWLGPRVFGLLR